MRYVGRRLHTNECAKPAATSIQLEGQLCLASTTHLLLPGTLGTVSACCHAAEHHAIPDDSA